MSKSSKGFGRAGLSALATSTLVIGACAAFVAPANADSSFQFTRVGGHDRYDVSANVAGMYGTADHVILASGELGKYADSLAANYLSGAINAPILLTKLDTTPAATQAALKQAGATKITIVGGPLSVSTQQEDALRAAGYTVDRISGHTRYDVDAAVIKAASKTGDTALIATGEKFPDALAAGPLSYAKNMPIGLVTLANAPSQVLSALKASGVTKAIVLGGDLSVSQETRKQIENAGITIVAELNGGNRAEVATMLADYEIDNYGFTNKKVNVATGRELSQGADALSAGPLTGKQNRPLLITASDPKVGTAQATGAALLDFLRAHASTLTGTDNLLFGGPLSISDAQKTLMEQAAQSSTNNGQVSLDSNTVQQGGALTGTITGNNIQSVSVKGCGLDQAIGGDSDAATAGRQFSLTVPSNQPAGNCTLTFTITNNDGTTSTETQNISVTAPSGPVALKSSTVQQGGSFSGTVSNPGTINSVSVTGCGFNNENVAVASDGSFSETLPAGQPAGSCTLTFNILRTDGTTQSQDVPLTVTAAPSSTTAAPDLLSAAADTTTDVVTYTFDQNVTGNTPNPGDFYVYDAAGNQTFAIAPVTVTGSKVTAQFPAGSTTGATLAAVANAAVSDAAGHTSYAASAPLNQQTQAAGVTTAPDLQSVSNFRTVGGFIVADFRFDEPVDTTAINANDFYIVANDGTEYQGGGVTATSVDARTVTVSFPGTTGVPIGSIVRGAAEEGAVTDGTNVNPTETEPRTGTPAFTTGVTADRTNDPDLTSVKVAGPNTVAYTFDEPVQDSPNAGNFYIYDAASNSYYNATQAVRSGSDTSVVNVTYPAGEVATAVGAGVEDNAVFAVDNGNANEVDEMALQSVSNTAGRTALPDLSSVKISSDAFGNNTVVYTFDSAVSQTAADNNQFGLVDAQGTLFTPNGSGVASGNTVTFTGANGFTNSQAAAAVVGNAEDVTALTNDLTTGDVQVQR